MTNIYLCIYEQMILKSIELQRIWGIGEESLKFDLKRFNLFIGKNNSGKSSVIRIIPLLHDLLSEPQNLQNDTRPMHYHVTASLNINTHNEKSDSIQNQNLKGTSIVKYSFYPPEAEKLSSTYEFIIQPMSTNKLSVEISSQRTLRDITDYFQKERFRTIKAFRKIGVSGEKVGNSESSFDLEGATVMQSWRKISASDRPHDLTVFEKVQKAIRDLLIPDLDRIVTTDENIISIVTKNKDGEGRSLPFNKYGAAFEDLFIILFEVFSCPDNCVFALEEPENHLHPALLRDFIKYLKEYTTHQYLITSHSTILLDDFIENDDSTVYSLSKIESQYPKSESIKEKNGALVDTLFNELGVKASDLLYSKCLVWVEGLSDRLYINKWIELFLNFHNKDKYIEGRDYSFVVYGAILEVLKPDMKKLNRNNFVILDRDNFLSNNATNMKRSNTNLTKKENKVRELTDSGITAIITTPPTIEGYLNEEIRQNYDISEEGKFNVIEPHKVAIASEICAKYNDWKHYENEDLTLLLNGLTEFLFKSCN